MIQEPSSLFFKPDKVRFRPYYDPILEEFHWIIEYYFGRLVYRFWKKDVTYYESQFTQLWGSKQIEPSDMLTISAELQQISHLQIIKSGTDAKPCDSSLPIIKSLLSKDLYFKTEYIDFTNDIEFLEDMDLGNTMAHCTFLFATFHMVVMSDGEDKDLEDEPLVDKYDLYFHLGHAFAQGALNVYGNADLMEFLHTPLV